MTRDKTPSEREAFDQFVDRLLSVPHSEIVRREQEYQERIMQNPKKRGPKRKVKPSAVGPESSDES
jgi:hypothetical protein